MHAFREFDKTIRQLGARFEERAATHDRDGSFVAENYRELREHKVFSAPVPRNLGGAGLSHRELCQLLRTLAWHCASTALALSMHAHLLATTIWRARHGLPGEALLRKVAESELVLVSTGAGDWLDSVGRAERVSGGFLVSAVKRFCSGCPVGDLLITSAPLADAERGDEVLHFSVPLRAKGVQVNDDWDALGMRGTGSHSVSLQEVFVPEEAIVMRRPRGQWHASWNVILCMAAPVYMAPYVGVAERAAHMASAALGRRNPDASALLLLGEVQNQLTLAQLSWQDMLRLTDDYAINPSVEHTSQMLVRKTLVAEAARACVAKAVEAVGGGALFRSAGLERLWRDVQGAPFHPLPELKQLAFTGRVALGMPPV